MQHWIARCAAKTESSKKRATANEAGSFEDAILESDSNSLNVEHADQFSNFQYGNEDCRYSGCDGAHHGGDDFEGLVEGWKHKQNPLFLELCSGCGILSATINALGFDVMPVDHKHNKHRVHIKTFLNNIAGYSQIHC